MKAVGTNLNLTDFAKGHGYDIVKILKAVELLEYCARHDVKALFCTELSDLGNKSQAIEIIVGLEKLGVHIFIKTPPIDTLPSTENQHQKLADMILAVSELNIKTMLSGRKKAKEEGQAQGRKKGYKKSSQEYLAEYAQEVKMLKQGKTKAQIQRETKVSKGTLLKLERLLKSNA
jgi:DNA invertase Pin-like site-specific DNA recombinase